MTPERWTQIEQFFHAALEHAPEARGEFLDAACAGDAELRNEVVALLAHDDSGTSFIETPAVEIAARQMVREQQAGVATAILGGPPLSDTPADGAGTGLRPLPPGDQPADTLAPGRVIGNFRIVRKIGAGGMGEVYLAEDLKLGRKVALKLLPAALNPDGRMGRRFLREARAASALNHPNIVTIHSAEEVEGLSFIEMEYIDGQSLRDRLLQGPLNLPEVIALGLQVCDAAAAAHAINIVHRDLKPANILIAATGQAKIVDFGLARIGDVPPSPSPSASGDEGAMRSGPAHDLTLASLSRGGSVSGTVPYMSPEQTRGEHLDARSDLFSLGCVLYEAAVGRRAFDGETALDIIDQIRTTAPPRPGSIRPGVPRAFDAIIQRALARDPQQRYGSAAQLAADLRRLRTHLAARTFLQRLRVPAAIAALLLIVFLVWYWRRVEHQAQVQRARDSLAHLPELVDEERFFDAHDLAQAAARYVPDDPALARWKPWITDVLSVTTDPPDAHVFLRRFQRDMSGEFPARQLIGTTPIQKLEIPRGDYLLIIEKAGYVPFQRTMSSAFDRVENGLWTPGAVRHAELVREPSGAFGMRIDSDAPLQIDVKLFQVGTIPEGMVYVPGGDYKLVAWDRPTEETVPLDEFFIDECEVAHREFKEFVDAGGYERPEFWKHPFLQHDPNTSEARELTWEEGICALKEPARGGPASWPNREFPAGKADHPVTNVTWYEAAAYAEFRGKQLPTIFQWEHAARGDARDRRWTVYAASMKPWGYTGLNQNIDDRANVMSTRPSSGTAPVRSFEFGVSPYGCYHMVGNVAEWCLNPRPDGFTTTGGSWRDGPNLFSGVGEYPGFYSAPTLGFRCVRNAPGATGDQGGMPFAKKADEVPVFEPLDEAAYRLLRSHYEYVRPPAKPLDAKIIEDVETDVWRRIKIRYIGAEGQRTDVPAPERLYALAYLWLPKSARPPYQVLNYKPGGPSYQGLKVPQETEVVCGPFIHAGRAVFVAVIAGMRERDLPLDWVDPEPGTVAYRDMMVYDTVDQRRGLDYLATRDDVDMERIACMGLSMGGYDLITMAVEERFRAVVLLAAGVSSQEGRTIEEANPVNFAPYIRGPKLMIHGRYDEGLPLRTRAEPLYRLLCDPKDLVVLDTGHFPPLDQWVPKVEEFLDRTFGPVSRIDPPPAAHRASAR